MAIDAAADLALFFDPDAPWAELGEYAPPNGGAAVPGVVLIRDADQSFVDLGRVSVAALRLVFLARVAQLPFPEEGGVITLANGSTVAIAAPPRAQDKACLVWRLECAA